MFDESFQEGHQHAQGFSEYRYKIVDEFRALKRLTTCANTRL